MHLCLDMITLKMTMTVMFIIRDFQVILLFIYYSIYIDDMLIVAKNVFEIKN